MTEWLKTYFMYMRVGACAIPPGIVYGMYRVRFGENGWVAAAALVTALVLAAITEYGWRTKK